MSTLPALGALATDATNSITENVAISLDVSCKFSADGTVGGTAVSDSKTFDTVTVVNGTKYNAEDATGTGGSKWSSTYGVYCNNQSGWSITAVGSGTVANAPEKMAPSNSSHDPIDTGTNASGATADWAFKVTKGSSAADSVAIVDGYSSYHTIPSTATTIITSSAATTASGKGSFSTGYQVYIGTDTVADTYTGSVTYTLAQAASTNQSSGDTNSDNSTNNNSSQEENVEPQIPSPTTVNNYYNTTNNYYSTNNTANTTNNNTNTTNNTYDNSNDSTTNSPAYNITNNSSTTESTETTENSTSSEDDDAESGKTSALGVTTSSSPEQGSGSSSDDIAPIAAITIAATAALAAGGYIIYQKSQNND